MGWVSQNRFLELEVVTEGRGAEEGSDWQSEEKA